MKLIFVYNAKSGLGNQAFDFAHKIISPSTYNCYLCALTHGNFGERLEWKAFRESSNVEMVFYHSDEFEKVYGRTEEYPVVLTEEEGKLKILMDPEAISGVGSPKEFIEGLKKYE